MISVGGFGLGRVPLCDVGTHRRASRRVACPQSRRIAIAGEAEVEGRAVDQRCLGAEAETAGVRTGRGAQEVIHQQGCDQRAVDDEPRIALDTLRIVAVVVDAVGVEGERRIAEQEYRIGR